MATLDPLLTMVENGCAGPTWISLVPVSSLLTVVVSATDIKKLTNGNQLPSSNTAGYFR